MSCRSLFAMLMILAFATVAFALPNRRPDQGLNKEIRHDPAFRAGFTDGYHQGSNDCEALSNSYNDEAGPMYQQASDGYTPQYGDLTTYQKLFRLGYIAGYKDGWDFNAGQYPPFGAGGGGP